MGNAARGPSAWPVEDTVERRRENSKEVKGRGSTGNIQSKNRGGFARGAEGQGKGDGRYGWFPQQNVSVVWGEKRLADG